ncbi:hypothetical protein SAMN05660706_13541 [Desulfoscipio geothermicus DSM 3669]|uniref:Uncharacterized protein n=2 Tax=Desulfoscipio geothermicus TaxID=39060 RepID=A0A1I6ECA9_9FIRM|nr:hypothetical protein SAMN05660706_13541 [Desulfoscipio geothermicus DSM 3669]
MENPVLNIMHKYIMIFAHDWARHSDRYLKGMAAGAIHAWYAVALEMVRTGQVTIDDDQLNEIRDEYLCLIHEGWCQKD